MHSAWILLRSNSSPSPQSLTSFYSNCLSVLTSLREILSCQDWHDFVFTSKKCYSTLLKLKSSSRLFIVIGSLFYLLVLI